MSAGTRFYALHLAGGGSDIACEDCRTEAMRERRPDGLVSVALTDIGPGEACAWCFAEKDGAS